MPADASFSCKPLRGTGPGDGSLGVPGRGEPAEGREEEEEEEEENFCFPCAAAEGGREGGTAAFGSSHLPLWSTDRKK